MLYGVVNIDLEILGGTPVFNGTRVPIKNLFDYIEGGEDLSEFLDASLLFQKIQHWQCGMAFYSNESETKFANLSLNN